MEHLIPVINKLQDLSNTMGTGGLNIQIPQIIVVGEQSSGKSSVLESLVGEPILPRGSGIVTRCPIVVQLIHESEETRKLATMFQDNKESDHEASSQSSDEETVRQGQRNKKVTQSPKQSKAKIVMTDEPRVEFLHKPDEYFTDFEKARAELESEVNKRAGKNKNIVEQELSLKIYSSKVINLTLVDLPGIVKNPTGGQPADIEMQVRNMILSYMENENTIILAVCSATNDMATSESIKLAKEIDPHGQRTIVVMTKLDLMDRGLDASKELTGRVLEFKLGIVGVVNRGQKDIMENKTIADSLKREEAFLQKKYPSIANYHGTKYLASKLQKILLEQIRKCIPPLQTTITDLIINTQNELTTLPESSLENKPEAMLAIIKEFCDKFSAAIMGKGRDIEKKYLTGGAQINEIFAEVLPQELKKIDPMKDLQTSTILTTIQNCEGIEATFLLSEKPFRDLARMQILRLEEPAITTANLVNTQIQNIIYKCMSGAKMNRFPNLKSAIIKETTLVLTACHQDAMKTLQKYVSAQGSFTGTINPEFNKEMKALIEGGISNKLDLKEPNQLVSGYQKSKVDVKVEELNESDVEESEDEQEVSIERKPMTPEQSRQCKIVRRLVSGYYKIVKDAFQDYCPKAIALEVIYNMESNLQGILTSKLHNPDKIEALVQESKSITLKRESAKRRLEDYEKAQAILEEVRDSQL